jgi:hypothetical protein
LPANALLLEVPDPLALRAVQAAYGAADMTRVLELADLISREHLWLLVVLDAIDEVHDIERLLGVVSDFGATALGRQSTVVLICREEALPGLTESIAALRPELLRVRDGALVHLEALREEEAAAFLMGEGATPQEVRRVQALLPPDLEGIPFFLRETLALVRAGSAPSKGDRLLETITGHAISDIYKRLRQNGHGPSRDKIARFLRELAAAIATAPTETISRAELAPLLGPEYDQDGENTLLSRTVHVGLVEERTQRVFGFAHALYFEYFAAKAVDAGASAWPVNYPPLRNASGKLLARRLVAFLTDPAPLLRMLLGEDALLACECAARVQHSLPSDLASSLAQAASGLLESRFRSDRSDALHLLALLGTQEARKAAARWYNAMTAADKGQWHWEAADLFLRLEEPGAFSVILGHYLFVPDMAWYEPADVAKLTRCGVVFRTAFADWTWEKIQCDDLNDSVRLRLVAVLSLLGDQRVVKYLNERVILCGSLNEAEHRALIHLNTEEAVMVYAESVEAAIRQPLDTYPGASEDERRNAYYGWLDSLVLRGTDIRMFPHDALTELVRMALMSARPEYVAFGLGWANFLQAPELIVPYMEAKRRRTGYLDLGPKLIEELIKILPFDKIKSIYDAHADPYIRGAIVRCLHEAPGPDTEGFLLELLRHREHVFDAVQSLGILRAASAGDAILSVYEESANEGIHRIAVRALGLLREVRAASKICTELRHVVEKQDVALSDMEYGLIKALGRIGGDCAVETLKNVFAICHNQSSALRAIFRIGNPNAILVASDLVRRHAISARAVAEAIAMRDFDDSPMSMREVPTPQLKDSALLALLLSEFDAAVSSSQFLDKTYMLDAVAHFDLPEAYKAIERIAFAEGLSELSAKRILASRGDVRAQRACVDFEIEKLADPRCHLSGYSAERLQRWPRGIVREALLVRIANHGDDVARWLFLLRWFATSEDRSLFERFEQSSNDDVADVAHRFLRKGSPMGSET